MKIDRAIFFIKMQQQNQKKCDLKKAIVLIFKAVLFPK